MEKELLSAYIDGEHADEKFTETLLKNGELQQSWAAYHHIRAVMRKETPVFLGQDFTAKLDALIEAEAAPTPRAAVTESQPLPQESHAHPFVQQLKGWFAPLTQMAVAAGVCLAVVLGVQSYTANGDHNNQAELPVLQTLPFNSAVQQVSYNAPTQDVASADQLEQKNRRIGKMLQNYELQRRIHGDSVTLSSNP